MNEKSKAKSISLVKIGAISGILSIVFYLSVISLSNIPDYVSRIMAFTFPLLWIIAFMGLGEFLKLESDTISLKIGLLFGIIGSAIALSFLVIQQGNFVWHKAAIELAESEDAVKILKATYKSVNRVQLGLDIVFDIFISISWFLFGINIASNSYFNRMIGWAGSIIAAILLIFNMISFPDPPSEIGLIDLGPFLGLWTLIIFGWLLWVITKQKTKT